MWQANEALLQVLKVTTMADFSLFEDIKVELSPLLVCLAVSYEGFGHWWWW